MAEKSSRTVSLPAPRGLGRSSAAAYIGVGVTLFERLVEENRMPLPRAIGGRNVWDIRELDAAFDELPYNGQASDAAGKGNGQGDGPVSDFV